MISWDSLTPIERLRILMETTLPTALMHSQWQALMEGEREAVRAVDWFTVLGLTRGAVPSNSQVATKTETRKQTAMEWLRQLDHTVNW